MSHLEKNWDASMSTNKPGACPCQREPQRQQLNARGEILTRIGDQYHDPGNTAQQPQDAEAAAKKETEDEIERVEALLAERFGQLRMVRCRFGGSRLFRSARRVNRRRGSTLRLALFSIRLIQ